MKRKGGAKAPLPLISRAEVWALCLGGFGMEHALNCLKPRILRGEQLSPEAEELYLDWLRICKPEDQNTVEALRRTLAECEADLVRIQAESQDNLRGNKDFYVEHLTRNIRSCKSRIMLAAAGRFTDPLTPEEVEKLLEPTGQPACD